MNKLNNVELPQLANGVTLSNAIASAINLGRAEQARKDASEAAKAERKPLTEYIFGMLSACKYEQRPAAIEAFAVACESKTDEQGNPYLPANWRKSSPLATQLSRARKVIATCGTTDFQSAESWASLVTLATERAKEDARKAEAEAEERAQRIALEREYGKEQASARIVKAKADVYVAKVATIIREAGDGLSVAVREGIFNLLADLEESEREASRTLDHATV
jgi:hypothetical protein